MKRISPAVHRWLSLLAYGAAAWLLIVSPLRCAGAP